MIANKKLLFFELNNFKLCSLKNEDLFCNISEVKLILITSSLVRDLISLILLE